MKPSHSLRSLLIVSLFAAGLSVGCANLQSVRDFGSSARDLGVSFDSVPMAFYTLCVDAGELRAFADRERGKNGISPARLRTACANARVRSELYTRLTRIVAAYGEHLSSFAGGEPAPRPVRWDRLSGDLLKEAGWDEGARKRAARVNELARRLAVPGWRTRWRLKSEILASEGEFREALALLGELPGLVDREIERTAGRLRQAESAARSGSGAYLEGHRRRMLALRESTDVFRKTLKAMETAHFSLARRARDGSIDFDDPGFEQEMRQLRANLLIDEDFVRAARTR